MVWTQRGVRVDHVRGRRHPLEVEFADLLDVVEYVGELTLHPLDLVTGQLEPGEPRDVQNLFAIQCHDRRRLRPPNRARVGGSGTSIRGRF